MKALSTFVFAVAIFSLTTTASAQKKGKSAPKQQTSQIKKQPSGSSSSSINQYNSRSSNEAKMQIGPKLGLNVSTMSYSPKPTSAEIGSVVGLTIGAELDYWFNSSLAIVPQVLYTEKGVHNDYTAALANATENITASYLEIPVHVKYRLSEGKFLPHVFAGPSLGFKMSATSKVHAGTREATTGISEQLTSTDLAFDLGVGGTIEISPKMQLAIDAQYQLGLTNVFVSSKDVNGQSRGFRMSATMLFPM